MDMHLLYNAKPFLVFFWSSIQRKEAESDPLLRVENGTTKLNDLPLSKGTGWEADKDLRA